MMPIRNSRGATRGEIISDQI